MSTTLSIERRGKITVVNVDGPLKLGNGSEDPPGFFKDLLKGGHKQFVFNGAGLSGIDGSGIGHLIGTAATIASRGGIIRLAALPQKTKKLIEETRVGIAFGHIYETVDEAVKSRWE